MPRVINGRSFVRLCLCFAFLAFLTVVPKAANPLFVPVEWQTTANVTIASGVVTKTSGCDGCPDGSVLSTLLPTTGDVYVRFVPNATGTMVVGLIQDGTTLSASAFALGFQISADGYWEVREAGVWVAEGMAGPTDEFRIGLEGDQVRYYVSGHVVYSRNRAAGTTYRFAGIFSDMGAGLADAAVATTSVTSQPAYAPVLWSSAANLTVGGSTVTKTSGCDGCPDAFAVSGSQTGSQDAYLEFPAVLDKRIVVGFIPTGEAVSLGAIDYGVGFFADGGWDVREGDGYRVDGTTGQGDIFRIALEGTRVTYYRNGWPIWTSARRDGISYRAVVLDYSSGGTLGGADLAINSAPVISPPGTPHFALATLGSMAIGAVDPEHDVMTFSASGLPSGLSLNPYSGIIAGTPTSAGESAVSVTAADLHGGTNTISFALVVDNTSPASTPTLTSVSPSSAAKGTQVTLTGTNFGAQADGGYVWLGTVPGTILSWSATQIVARVDPDAATGVAQVRLPTGDSNTLSFSVAESSNCSYTLSPAAVTTGPEGATGTLAISTPSNCAWTVSSPETWVTLSAMSGVGPATINYTIGLNSGSSRSATLTIGNASVVISQSAAQPPVLLTVSPDSGIAGTQVTLTGSNFGAVQNGGSVWLGTRQASVVNWSDTSITATVASGSTTGTAQVRRIDVASNALPFAVITAMISGVTPSSGPLGTVITISGTGFGATQGASTVWFGSSPVTATSWSDTQIEATIPSNATAAGLTVLRAGVLSNSATFAVTGTAPRIDGIWPTSGGPGTTVFILGQGFGVTQGAGSVLLGGAAAAVTTWSDSSVQVTVGNTALSGPLKLQQNGLWSNAKSFVIASASGASVTLSPNLFNLVVGESRSIQALDALGADVPGLTWTSSNPAVVTVSNDPSPLITAVAPGNATIRAGDALAEVTVFAEGGMPEGTVLWSVPGPISGVSDIAVAVPAAGAIADVFAIGLEGEVQAITVDGTVAWTVPGPFGFGAGARSDFQGGLVVFKRDRMARLDPLTGQTTTLYANANAETVSNGLATPAIHPNGKVLTVDYTCHDLCDGQDADDSAGVVGIDLSSGSRAFRVPLANSTFTTTNVDSAFCGNADGDGTHTQQQHSWPNNQLTIAADGFAYLSYLTYHSTGTRQGAAQQPYPAAAYPLFEQMRAYSSARDWSNALATLDALLAAINEPNNSVAVLLRGDYTSGDYGLAFSHENAWAPQFQRACNTTTTLVTKMHLMRVNGEGQSSDAVVKEWTATDAVVYTLNASTQTYTSVETHTGPSDVDISEHVITNTDQGALYSWQVREQCFVSGTFGTRTYVQVDPCAEAPENHLTTVTEGVPADVLWSNAGQDGFSVQPVLQLEDGSFAASNAQGVTVFDAQGQIKWTAPAGTPTFATAGGGLVTTDGLEFDASGVAIAIRDVRAQSWRGLAYQVGSIEQLVVPWVVTGNSVWAVADGNLARNGTASSAIVPYDVQVDFQIPNPWGVEVLSSAEDALVRSVALQTMREAYQGYAVTFTTENPSSRRHIYVRDLMKASVGRTVLGAFESDVYAPNLWNTLMTVIGCRTLALSDCLQATGRSREDVIKAFAKGIGNTAAHELGHQAPIYFVRDLGCLNCYDNHTAESFAHFFGPLSWSNEAKQKMQPLLKRQ